MDLEWDGGMIKGYLCRVKRLHLESCEKDSGTNKVNACNVKKGALGKRRKVSKI